MSGGRKEAEGSCVRLEVIPTPALMCPSLKQLLLKLNMLDVRDGSGGGGGGGISWYSVKALG